MTGDDVFQNREINLVQILDVKASDAGGMRSQPFELLLVSCNTIHEINRCRGLTRGKTRCGDIPLATALVLVVVLAEPDDAAPKLRPLPSNPRHKL
jgi:hypothetical protein